MNAQILCALLAQRIPPEQFQIWGTEIHWMDEKFNTPENRAIIEGTIKDYDILAASHVDTIKAEAEKESLIQEKIREQAITALQAEGKLTIDEKLTSKPIGKEEI